MKNRLCQICKGPAEPRLFDYASGLHDQAGREIVVKAVAEFKCLDERCTHNWLPLDQERKIDRKILRLKGITIPHRDNRGSG